MQRCRLRWLPGLALLALSLLVPALPAHAAVTTVGTYYPVTPSRLVDTRTGLGSPSRQPLGPVTTLQVQVVGRGGVPRRKVSAVVLNVTVTNATADAGHLSVSPTGTGTSRGVTSALNYNRGRTTAASATVGVGEFGEIEIYNSSAGTADVIVDVLGFYNASAIPAASLGTGSGYHPVDAERIADTRTSGGALGSRQVLTGLLNLDRPGENRNVTVRALALNVTATGASGGGFLTAWNGDGRPPAVSTLNFEKSTAVANLTIVPTSLDPTGRVRYAVLNGSAGRVHVVVDLVGLYTTDALGAGLRFTPLQPYRMYDSRARLGEPLGLEETRRQPALVNGVVPHALVTSTTVIHPSATTVVTLWDTDVQPVSSSLNAPAGRTVANGTITPLAPDGTFLIFNRRGRTDYTIDVTGRFDDVETGGETVSYDIRHSTHVHPLG